MKRQKVENIVKYRLENGNDTEQVRDLERRKLGFIYFSRK